MEAAVILLEAAAALLAPQRLVQLVAELEEAMVAASGHTEGRILANEQMK